MRALAESSGSSGGYFVPTIVVAQLIDLARNAATVLNAGAHTVAVSYNGDVYFGLGADKLATTVWPTLMRRSMITPRTGETMVV